MPLFAKNSGSSTSRVTSSIFGISLAGRLPDFGTIMPAIKAPKKE
jgi:hypothetical protein